MVSETFLPRFGVFFGMNRLIPWVALASLLYLGSPQTVLGQRAVELRPVATGLQSPLLVTHAGDDSGRLFVVEQVGRIRIIRAGALVPQPFMDISSRVESGGEKGLLGLAFHPDFASNRGSSSTTRGVRRGSSRQSSPSARRWR